MLSEKKRAEAKDKYKKSRHTPKDLRWKGSKAKRTGLSKHQAALKTNRAAKKSSNFKPRKFAVAA